jgi:carboxyl-terminal processing protease
MAMVGVTLFASCLTIVSLTFPPVGLPAGEHVPGGPPEAAYPIQAWAREVWEITEVVLDRHLDPPARQEMLLGATRSLVRAAKGTLPADASRRISSVTDPEHFARVLQRIWNEAGAGATASTEQLAAALMEGLSQQVPGKPMLIPPDQSKAIEQASGNRYIGIGIQIGTDGQENLPKIITPIRGGPAHRAGMKPEDLILEVDGRGTQGLLLSAVVDMLRGDEGTSLAVVVRQPGASDKRTLKMTRSVVLFESVLGYRRDADAWTFRVAPDSPLAYLALGSVNSATLNDLRKIEDRLQSEGLDALVLDLRFLADGSLHHVALLADALLERGLMWRVRQRGDRVRDYRADPDCLFRGWPLVVLVNGETGPGAEWLAAALQDNGRAIVVGEPTRGNNFVKEFVSLPAGRGSLLVRTGKVERAKPPSQGTKDADASPGGRPEAWVVHPDHVVALDAKQKESLRRWHVERSKTELPGGAFVAPPEDPQLDKALELLKAVSKGPEKTR